MIVGAMMRVCRECPDNHLPECGKGGCERRDAAMRQQKACRDAHSRRKQEQNTLYSVTVGRCRKAGQR